MRYAPTLVLAAAIGLAACASKPPVVAAPSPSASPQVKVTEPYFGRTKAAVATLTPSPTSGVTGIVTFSGSGTSVDVRVLAAGLQPGSIHAFHVHATGNCASADFLGAGDHFNPTHKPHGAPDQPHHAGDMPSLLADPAGTRAIACTCSPAAACARSRATGACARRSAIWARSRRTPCRAARWAASWSA